MDIMLATPPGNKTKQMTNKFNHNGIEIGYPDCQQCGPRQICSGSGLHIGKSAAPFTARSTT
jgi:hypothetical protein